MGGGEVACLASGWGIPTRGPCSLLGGWTRLRAQMTYAGVSATGQGSQRQIGTHFGAVVKHCHSARDAPRPPLA